MQLVTVLEIKMFKWGKNVKCLQDEKCKEQVIESIFHGI